MAEEEKVTEELEKEAETAEEPQNDAQPEKKKKKDRKSDRHAEELEKLQAELAAEKEARLRLAAEYDNYRKRTAKEKDRLYSDGVSDTVGKLFPIYDNLVRALNQPTEDEAYKKGVEMIMTSMLDVLAKCGVEAFGEPGEQFNPELHNAVMHTEDESLGENTITDVFQKGFRKGDKIIRFAMVKVAN